MNVKLKPGYKQTEVWVIPDDWIEKRLGDTAILKARIGWQGLTTAEYLETGDYYLITGTDFKGGYIDWDHCHFVEESRYKQDKNIQLRQQDVLVTKDGTIGKVALVNHLDKPATLNSGVFVIRPINEAFHPDFFYYLLCSNFFLEFLNQLSAGSTINHLYQKDFVTFNFKTPSTIGEQIAIAEALSDADALIESLDQLITKKRNIKQGAMQELLLPKDGCEVKMLCEVSSLKGRIGWQGLKQTEFTTNQDEPYLITGMNFKDGAIRWNEVYHISEERYEIAKEIQLKADDVLMTKDGTIGKMLYIDSIPYPEKASLNSHLLLFRPIRESYFPKYLYYQLTSKRFADFIELSKSGTTFFGISQTSVGKYPVLLPPMEEQILIATTLSDMDAEIAALETQLAKTRSLKQGMMHNLLTGRIRLL
ncbi:MAG: restriction endonuclease subunit S [Methylobacter sp.]